MFAEFSCKIIVKELCFDRYNGSHNRDLDANASI